MSKIIVLLASIAHAAYGERSTEMDCDAYMQKAYADDIRSALIDVEGVKKLSYALANKRHGYYTNIDSDDLKKLNINIASNARISIVFFMEGPRKDDKILNSSCHVFWDTL